MTTNDKKECVACAELIQLNAKVCRFCGYNQGDEAPVSHHEVEEKTKEKKKFYQSAAFWIVSVLVILAALNGQNLFQFTTSQLTGEVTLDSGRVEDSIESGILEQRAITVTASCPSRLAGKVGDVRQCTVEDEFGTMALVDVTVQSTNGDITWEVRN